MRIILIGFMGAGKSHLGSRVAGERGLPFYDTDSMIERKTGKTISEIFTDKGEKWFRQMESEILCSLPDKGIFATGGGIVELPQNRVFLKVEGNICIWLNPPWDVLYARIAATDRPLLQKLNREGIYDLWLKRLPLYEECAEYILTDEKETGLRDLLTKLGIALT